MKVPLLKASFLGKKQDLKKVIEALKSTGAFEMTYFKHVLSETSDSSERENIDRLSELKMQIKHAITFTQKEHNKHYKSIWNVKSVYDYDQLKSFKDYETAAIEITKQLEEINSRINRIKLMTAKNKETVRDLKPYLNLPAEFSKLQSTNSVFILCGIMPYKQFQKFERDFDLSQMALAHYQSGDGNVCAVISCHRDDAAIAEAIYNYEFERCKFNFTQNAKDTVQTLLEQNDELEVEHKILLQKALLLPEDVQMLKKFYDYVCNELDTYELISNIIQTKNHYVLHGWVIADAQQKITEIVNSICLKVEFKFDKINPQDNPPVLVKNKEIFTPFQQITNMYGQPSESDIDPNPFVSIFYFIFFGMMIGDVGYGALLTLVTAIIIYVKKPFGNSKKFFLLFCFGGISAFLWGFLYGSAFGFEIPTGIINPIESATYLLLLSLGLGLIQITFGICLSFFRNMVNGKYWDAFLDSIPRIVLFIGLFMFLPNLAVKLFKLDFESSLLQMISVPGMYIALGGLCAIVLFNGRNKKGFFGKIVGSFSGAYSLVNYFSDIISYARLFALALVGTVIASIGNTMGELMFGIQYIGIPLGIIIALAFHAFNLGLGLLSAYVHGARLQFIEFFSKFYSGEGLPFKAIGSNLKYSRIKGGL